MSLVDVEALMAKVKALEAENARLRALCVRHGLSFAEEHTHTAVPPEVIRLSPEQKVALFREVFKGREDVFARRWYSLTTKKSGYQPVCVREWNREFCRKPSLKCSECGNRLYAAIGYEDVYNHLAGRDEYGRDVIGLYPMLTDNMCWLLCADFDDKSCEHGYRNDVTAFVSVCRQWDLPCYVERSRSGNGAHVWIFFASPIAAAKARRLGNAVLTEAMSQCAMLSFKSYDRFFPNQDSLGEGGLGNLVALPLHGKARRLGNSVFVDDNFEPYPDQWQVLANILRVGESAVDDILKRHQTASLGELVKSSEAKPWESPQYTTLDKDDFSAPTTIVESNMLYLPLKGLSAKVLNLLKRMAAFRNPEFYAKQGMRLSTFNIPRIISCSEITSDYLALPRGCIDDVVNLLNDCGASYHIEDKTCHGKPIDVSFHGSLRPDQAQAMDEMLRYNCGTLSATTAFGKTVFAIAMVAQRKVNTLILVHRKSLLDQWQKQLETFLHLQAGVLYGGKNSLQGVVDVALIQSCLEDGEAKSLLENYGMVIVDECHHVSSVSFEQVLKNVKARYVYGLTATPIRKDGHQPIIFMQCGKIRFSTNAEQQMSAQDFTRILIPRFTSFRDLAPDEKSYSQIIAAMAIDEVRNNLIVEDVKAAIAEGRTPLVLSSLTTHVRTLAEMLKPLADHVITLVGSDSTKDKREAMAKLESITANESLIIVASGKYIGEGFDYPRLDTLFLALPISWKGVVAQYAGRLHREHTGKTEVRIYDYVDIRVPLCDSMYRKRIKGYASVGYRVIDKVHCNEQDNAEAIYSGSSFNASFERDITNATRSIVISVPSTKARRAQRLVRILQDLQHIGIEVVIHISEPGFNDNALAGLTIFKHESRTTTCAIIDKTIAWYGDINFLGYNTDDNHALRITSTDIAHSLLDLLYQ